MKKIIGIIHPFDMKQTFHVYEGTDKLETIEIQDIDEVPDIILNLCHTYNVYQINLTGARSFTEGVTQKLQEKEINKYNENKISITYI